MWLRCTGLAILAASAGCATATPPQGGGPGASDPDAAVGGRLDAPAAHPDATSSACGSAYTGVLATWSFTGETGMQTATAVASVAPGVIASNFARSAGLSPSSGTSSINSSNWPVAAQLDTAKYYALTITAPSGCSFTVTGLATDLKTSATGPAVGSIATSADGFAQLTPVGTNAQGMPALAIADAKSLELRIYGYSASSTSGTMRAQNTLTISGSLH